MDPDVVALKGIIQNDCWTNVVDGVVRLVESVEGTERSILVSGLSENAFAIKLDDFPVERGFLEESSELGLGKRCDYALIDPDRKILIFLELKFGGSYQTKEATLQIKGGVCVFSYLQRLLDLHLGCSDPFSKYENRYIILGEKGYYGKRLSKQETARNVEAPREISLGNRRKFPVTQML